MIRQAAKALLLMFALVISWQLHAAEKSSLEQRLLVLEDKEAIRTLIFNYGRFVDDRDWNNFANLFASDAGTWNGGMGIATGRDAIHKMMTDTMGGDNANAAGTGFSNVHLLGNEIIAVTGDTATALSKWVFVMTAETGGPDFVFVGRYEDSLVRENGEWKFQQRIVHGDISRQVVLPGLNSDAAK